MAIAARKEAAILVSDTGGGYPISVMDAQRMVDYHLVSRQPLNLFNKNGQKIRAFNLNNDDVAFLMANDNGEDLLLMPALRDQEHTGESIAKKQITFIFSWLSGNQTYSVSLYDYTKPCPNNCASF